jgi:ATP-dependent Lon protease
MSNQLTETGITLRDTVVFPQTVKRLRVSEDVAIQDRHVVALFTKKEGVCFTGVLCELIDEQRQPDGHFLVVEGMKRVTIHRQQGTQVTYSLCDTTVNKTSDLLSLSNTVYDLFKEHHGILNSEDLSLDTLLSVIHPDQPEELADFISSYLPIRYDDKVAIIESVDVYHRLEQVKHALNQLLMDAQMNHQLDDVIQENVNIERKEMMLKAKLRAIQTELNATIQADVLDEYTQKLTDIRLPLDHHQLVLSAIQRLDQFPDDSTEFASIKGYLDTFFSIPWRKRKAAKIDIKRVRQELDAHHFGLASVKSRILEHLAIRKVAKKRMGTILCLSGPPGVGKTSIVKSVASALRRPFVHMALGGVRDEADLRGHRRAYVGAMPGKLISGLIRAQAMNPVICLDEVDKLAGGFKGDFASVLLEILDIEQNKTFVDHYIQCPVDLSQCMFVCTANDLSAIPDPLLNRMEVIPISGYTVAEKVAVAQDYIFPMLCESFGLPIQKNAVSTALWTSMVQQYTSDVGLRELRQMIDKLCRKMALKWVEGDAIPKIWTESFVTSLLGEGVPKPTFSAETRVGRSVALMLASMGGYCCPIETQIYQGDPGFTVTGTIDPKLDDAIRIVFGLLKTRFKEYAIDANLLFDYHFHIHFQAPNVYKTGMGWELPIFVSIVSTLLGIPLPGNLTFSGQLSLSGQLLPVGGVSQRQLAGAYLGVRYLVVSTLEAVPSDTPTASPQLVPLATIDDMMALLIKWYL